MAETKKVLLITTGELERVALADSLERFFNDPYDFMALQHPIEFLPSRQTEGFTSERVDPSLLSDEQLDHSPVTHLVTELVAALSPEHPHEPLPDLVIAVDAVNVANLDQIATLTTCFRRAVARHLTRYPSVRKIVKERCAFHLLSPMIESYLYVEQHVLALATSRGAKPHPSIYAYDLEQFRADGDPDYQRWLAQGDLDPSFCNRDPGRYIHYLRGDEPGAKSSQHEEIRHGAAALRAMAWEMLTPLSASPSAPATPRMQCIHALLEEIVSLAGGHPYWDTSQAPTRAASTCLRNL